MCYLLSSILSICGQGGRLAPIMTMSGPRHRNDNHRHFVSRSQSPAPRAIRATSEDHIKTRT